MGTTKGRPFEMNAKWPIKLSLKTRVHSLVVRSVIVSILEFTYCFPELKVGCGQELSYDVYQLGELFCGFK